MFIYIYIYIYLYLFIIHILYIHDYTRVKRGWLVALLPFLKCCLRSSGRVAHLALKQSNIFGGLFTTKYNDVPREQICRPVTGVAVETTSFKTPP